MESRSSEHKDQLKELERLTQKIQEKAEELLKQDGKLYEFYPNRPKSLVARYGFESPLEIAGISTLAPQASSERGEAKLTVNRHPANWDVPADTVLVIGILDEGLEDATFTLVLKQGRPPSFQYHRKPGETGGNRFDVREARKSDLEDFLGIIKGKLYVITPKEVKDNE